MATGQPDSPIQPPDEATPAPSEDEKAQAAQAEAEAAAEAEKAKPDERFIEYVVPRRATASYIDEKGKRRKIETRPSEAHRHATVASDGSYSSRVGVANAKADISVQDWAAVGISATDNQVWEFANDWRVPARRLSAEQIDYLLVEDRKYNGVRFELVDGNGNSVDR